MLGFGEKKGQCVGWRRERQKNSFAGKKRRKFRTKEGAGKN